MFLCDSDKLTVAYLTKYTDYAVEVFYMVCRSLGPSDSRNSSLGASIRAFTSLFLSITT